MKARTIIDALTRMGCTEGMGVMEFPYDYTFQDYLESYFGGDDKVLLFDGKLKYETPYLYSYDERLWNLSGTLGADVVINIIDANEEKTQIFLYEIE